MSGVRDGDVQDQQQKGHLLLNWEVEFVQEKVS